MSELIGERERRREALKRIILDLHAGLSPQEARERFLREVGSVASSEIAEMEQALINEGMRPEEIKRFCNVHALLFEGALAAGPGGKLSEAHPVELFKKENREIERLTGRLRELARETGRYSEAAWREEVGSLLRKLEGLEVHYTRKEQVLFPYLERAGFFGPSKVMWGKDDEVRELLKGAIRGLEAGEGAREWVGGRLVPLLDEVEGMVFKEENILFPTSLEKLSPGDWVKILRESEEVGYAFIERPGDIEHLVAELGRRVVEEPGVSSGRVSLPTGSLGLDELAAVLNTLPVDITFIDSEDKVRYFSAGRERVFVRTGSVIGRKVQNCHPPKSVAVVERILGSFKSGERDRAEFWINLKGRLIYIRYFAVRDPGGSYLGTLEVTQDVTDIRKLEGERRLLDWG
ncbi:MAG: DUF438 domain-containing protein [Thermoplasmata archaeon]